MSAKPLIDIVVGVDDLQEVDKPLLKSFSKAGFLWLRVERPGEMVLAKFSDDTYKEKTHFIHLVDYQKELWNNLIFFRDHLNSNEDERKQYLEIKLDYLKASSDYHSQQIAALLSETIAAHHFCKYSFLFSKNSQRPEVPQF